MADVTQILSRIEQGDESAANELLPLVYDELRKLATAKMASENPGHTLQATALTHEAYLRLVDVEVDRVWKGRQHFLAVASVAMRQILVDWARKRSASKRGGGLGRIDLDDVEIVDHARPDDLIELDDAITQLASRDKAAAKVAELRLFSGQTIEQVASILGISSSTAHRRWLYARAFLHDALTSTT